MDTLNRTPGIAYASESPAGKIAIAMVKVDVIGPGIEGATSARPEPL
jgi:hypothetical protein